MASLNEGHSVNVNNSFDDNQHSPDTAAPHHHRRILPPLPDLRFEYSYLRSIRQYVHVERKPASRNNGDVLLPSDAEELERGDIIRVQWGQIVWVTMRDQVLSPLVQGAVWGLAGHFLFPLRGAVVSTVKSWWGTVSLHPNNEGSGIALLRSYAGRLNSGNVKTGLAR